MTRLILDAVSVLLRGRAILRGVSLKMAAGGAPHRPGELVALIGPNGAGKTTLLRAAMGLRPIGEGTVRLDGQDPGRMPAGARARLIAYLPQTRPLAWPLKVRDVVALGRFAHGDRLGKLGDVDQAAIGKAMSACGLGELADRATDTLSGGELSRVHLARALAAEAPLLLADEPVAALDPLHAHQALEVLRRFCRSGGSALVTLHDIALAARFADRVVILSEGQVVGDGPPCTVLTPETLAATYGMRAEVRTGPEGIRIDIAGPV